MKTTMACVSYLIMLMSMTEARRLQQPIVCEGMRVECQDNPNKLFICHDGNTLCVSENAVASHLDNHDDDYCGECHPDDDMMPCVAVIDEDSGFQYRSDPGTNQEAMWEIFRAQYPDRPFCLLKVKENRDYGGVHPPTDFLNDVKTIYVQDIRRDKGDDTKAEDWVELCGLTEFSPSSDGFVGLFVDISTSMVLSTVRASYDDFKENLSDRGIQIRELMDPNENWILPFLNQLAP